MAVYKNDYSKDEDFALWRLHEIRNKMTGWQIRPDEINKTVRQIIHKYRLKKRIVSHMLPLATVFIFFSTSFLFAQTPTPDNTITLTTYYPAPFGAYKKMTISDSVGIGTTNPSRAKLEISGSVGGTSAIFGPGSTGISISGGGYWPTIGFNTYSDGFVWRSISAGYAGAIDVNQTNGNMGFAILSNAVDADESLISNHAIDITPAGNVGIGTATPFQELTPPVSPPPAGSLEVKGRIKAGDYLVVGGGDFGPWIGVPGGATYRQWIGKCSAGSGCDFGIGDYLHISGWSNPAFGTNAQGNTRRVIALWDDVLVPSGNVGIGTVDPRGKLDVRGGMFTTALTDNIIPGNLYTSASDEDSSYDEEFVISLYDPTGDGQMGDDRSSIFIGPSHTNGDVGRIELAARLISIPFGNVGIGTAAPSKMLQVAGSVRIGNNTADAAGNSLLVEDYIMAGSGILSSGSLSGGFGSVLESWGVGSLVSNGAISAQGDITGFNNLTIYGTAAKPGGGPWASTSDIRLKQNIQPLQGSLDKLLRLRGVSFEWKDPTKQGNLTGVQRGMIAQEVEQVFPEWVSTGADGYKMVGFTGFEALTVEALRELKNENETLKARIKSLEEKIDQMK